MPLAVADHQRTKARVGQRSRAKGFGLLDGLLYLGLAGVAISGATYLLNRSAESRRTDELISEVTMIRQAVEQTYGTAILQTSNVQISLPILVNGGLVDSRYLTTDSTGTPKFLDPWKNQFSVSGNNGGGYWVAVNNLSGDVCTRLVNTLAPDPTLSFVTYSGLPAAASGVSATQGTATSSQITPEWTASTCAGLTAGRGTLAFTFLAPSSGASASSQTQRSAGTVPGTGPGGTPIEVPFVAVTIPGSGTATAAADPVFTQSGWDANGRQTITGNHLNLIVTDGGIARDRATFTITPPSGAAVRSVDIDLSGTFSTADMNNSDTNSHAQVNVIVTDSSGVAHQPLTVSFSPGDPMTGTISLTSLTNCSNGCTGPFTIALNTVASSDANSADSGVSITSAAITLNTH